ncbi:hypothetical protein, partial [Ruthenibacterium lactatiformans]|uniref:hypothetical protein n=1 Tax=Ruthenibacterium lactatiformans TaxID=1550024 RepID=UPI003AB42974
ILARGSENSNIFDGFFLQKNAFFTNGTKKRKNNAAIPLNADFRVCAKCAILIKNSSTATVFYTHPGALCPGA